MKRLFFFLFLLVGLFFLVTIIFAFLSVVFPISSTVLSVSLVASLSLLSFLLGVLYKK